MLKRHAPFIVMALWALLIAVGVTAANAPMIALLCAAMIANTHESAGRWFDEH